MRNKKDNSWFPFILAISLIAIAGYGWVMNLIALIDLEPFIFSGKVIVSIIGVFVPPIGVIMGLFIW